MWRLGLMNTPAHSSGAMAVPNSTEAVAADAISRELEQLGVTAERLNSDERLKIIAALEANGIFLLKGAVKDVAAGLHCSQASVYRYLSQLKSAGTPESDE